MEEQIYLRAMLLSTISIHSKEYFLMLEDTMIDFFLEPFHHDFLQASS